MRALGLGIAAIAILGVSALLDEKSGFGVWRVLGDDLSRSLARVAQLQNQNEAMRREIEMLEVEPAAIDRAIREELDLALPGEIIVRFSDLGGAVLPENELEEHGNARRGMWLSGSLDQETK